MPGGHWQDRENGFSSMTVAIKQHQCSFFASHDKVLIAGLQMKSIPG
jgi:hypothetical protein